MPSNPLSKVVAHLRKTILRKTILRQEVDHLTDGQLLDRFLETRDDAAFAALVRRHGPMVWGVCLRIVGHAEDAEDAFQATFLILVRKAAAVKPREAVGNWLYGVASNAALKARAASARVRAKEKQGTSMPEPAKNGRDDQEELQRLLDQALGVLPDKYRLPVVLCHLEGRTRKEVAAQLKIPEGTLSSRLATAHQMLAKRLARHGLAVSGASLAALFAQDAASASVPTTLVSSTIKTATIVAAIASNREFAGVVSTKVTALTEGVMNAMLLKKLSKLTVMLVAAVLVTFTMRNSMMSILVLGRAVAVVAPASAQTSAADLKALQGEWVLISDSLGGPIHPTRGDYRCVFDGTRLTHFSGEEVTARWEVTVDASKAPKWMDLKAGKESLFCIYRLSGETLTCSFRNRPNNSARPSDFEPHPGVGVHIYKRKRP